MPRWLRMPGRRPAGHGTGTGVGHPPAYRRASRVLTEILLDIPRLQRRDGRLELLAEADERLVKTTGESSVARDHLRAVVKVARRIGALEALMEALLAVEPHDIDTAWFELAVTVLTGPGALDGHHMFALISELRTRPPEFGRTTVAVYAAERRAEGRPLDVGHLPRVLLRLYDARAGGAGRGDRRTDLLRFLQLLGEELQGQGHGDGLAKLIARIQRAWAATPGAAAPVGAVGPVGLADGRRQVIIQIRVEEEDALSDLPFTRRRYSLRGFYYERTGDATPEFRGTRSAPGLFTGEQLESRGRDFLDAWREPTVAARGVRKRVEFLLPHSLLGYPAELWPTASGVPLSRSCQVVVRSLPRYQDSTIHDEWIRRWERLDRGCRPGDALERIGWMGPSDPEEDGAGRKGGVGDGAGRDDVCETESPSPQKGWPVGKYPPLYLTDAAQVEGWLRGHPDLACLGLGAPYDINDSLIRDAVCEALLEDGIPVMVWRRDGGEPGRLVTALCEGEPPALLADLPHSVHQARRLGRRDALGLSNQITLLWDDPTCVHGDQDHQMSGTRGSGEGAV